MEQPDAVGMAAFHPNEGAWALPAGSVTQHRRSPEGRDVVGLSCARKVHRRCCVRVLVLLEAVPPPYSRDGISAQLTGWKADNLQLNFTAWSFVTEEWWLSLKASSDETDLLPLFLPWGSQSSLLLSNLSSNHH